MEMKETAACRLANPVAFYQMAEESSAPLLWPWHH